MAKAKIISIATGISVTRDGIVLIADDEIFDGDEIIARSNGPQFGLDAYVIQQRESSAWADAITITLSAEDGSSHWRKDKFGVTGDADSSVVTNLLTLEKGARQIAHALQVLIAEEDSQGGVFTYPAEDGDTYRGVFSGIGQTSDLEMGGFQEGIDAQLVSSLGQWITSGVNPTIGQVLLWHDNSSIYRITKVDSDEISFVLTLSSINE